MGIFVVYTIRIAVGARRGAAPGRPGALSRDASRTDPVACVVGGLFLFAAPVILLVAEPFAEALVGTGRELDVSEFLLVQWLAPLASEAPELLVAGLYAWRLNTNAGLGTLVSSKVNQWTLLVGTLPIVFAARVGQPCRGCRSSRASARSCCSRRRSRCSRSRPWRRCRSRFARRRCSSALFFAQFVIGAPRAAPRGTGIERIARVGGLPGPGASGSSSGSRRHLPALLRDGFRTPHEELRGRADGPRS